MDNRQFATKKEDKYENKIIINGTTADEIAKEIKTLLSTKNPIVVFRVLQDSYPQIWEALKQVAKTLHLSENVEFLDDVRDLFQNPSDEKLAKLVKKHIQEERINVDSEQTKPLDEAITSGDSKKAKIKLSEINTNIAKLLAESLVSRGDFEQAFKKAYAPSSSLTKKN